MLTKLTLVAAVDVVSALHQRELVRGDALRNRLVCLVGRDDLVVRPMDGNSRELRDGQTCRVHVHCEPVVQIRLRHLILTLPDASLMSFSPSSSSFRNSF